MRKRWPGSRECPGSMRWPSSKGSSRTWPGSLLHEEGLQGVEGKEEEGQGQAFRRLKRVEEPIDIKEHEVEQEMLVSLKATPTSHMPRQILNEWSQEKVLYTDDSSTPPYTPNGFMVSCPLLGAGSIMICPLCEFSFEFSRLVTSRRTLYA